MFSKLDQATIKKNWIEEMSEGVPKLDKSMAEDNEENVVVRIIYLFFIFRTSLTLFKAALQNFATKKDGTELITVSLPKTKKILSLLFFLCYSLLYTKCTKEVLLL